MTDETREPRTEQVRIIGAERAGGPIDPDDDSASAHAEDEGDAAGDPWLGAGAHATTPDPPTMLHWTDAPTGEVPAVLDRGGPRLTEPTWREEPADWEQHDRLPFLDDGEQNLLGSEEDQPWEFELSGAIPDGAGPDPPAPASADDAPSTTADGLGTPPRETERADPVAQPVPDPQTLGTSPVPRRRRGRHQRAIGAGKDEAGDERELAGLATLGAEVRDIDRSGRSGGNAGEEAPGGDSRSERGRISRRAGRDLPVAASSGVVIGGLVLVAFHFGPVPAMVVATVVVTLAAVEAYAAFRRGGYHPATLLGLVAVVAVMLGAYTKGEQALPLVLVLLVAFTLLWQLLGVDQRADAVRSTASTLLVFCWVGVFGSFGALLLAPSIFGHRHGVAYLLGAIIAAVAYDVGALAVGAWVGRHPVSSASPSKTWEGLAGGAVLAIVVSLAIVHLIHPWTLWRALALGIVVAFVSPVGDLGESLVKRHLGLKDIGRLLPGHGGFLDRIDGLLFVLPATYYLLRAFHAG